MRIISAYPRLSALVADLFFCGGVDSISLMKSPKGRKTMFVFMAILYWKKLWLSNATFFGWCRREWDESSMSLSMAVETKNVAFCYLRQ